MTLLSSYTWQFDKKNQLFAKIEIYSELRAPGQRKEQCQEYFPRLIFLYETIKSDFQLISLHSVGTAMEPDIDDGALQTKESGPAGAPRFSELAEQGTLDEVILSTIPSYSFFLKFFWACLLRATDVQLWWCLCTAVSNKGRPKTQRRRWHQWVASRVA